MRDIYLIKLIFFRYAKPGNCAEHQRDPRLRFVSRSPLKKALKASEA
jgi:hypothetical protein